MPWWKLEVIEKDLNDYDREHIADLIKQGYTEGDLSADKPGYEDDDEE